MCRFKINVLKLCLLYMYNNKILKITKKKA